MAPKAPTGALYDIPYRNGFTTLAVSMDGQKYMNTASGVSPAAVRSATVEIEGGYILEVAIPLRCVMLPPVANANVGFNLRISTQGRQMRFSMYDARAADGVTDRRRVGRLVLKP